MDINIDNPQTSLNISEDVIKTIAIEVIKELKDIYGLCTQTSKPVRINFGADAATVDVSIIVNMNCKITDAATRLQEALKNTIQDMTGVTISKVNIHVMGVHAGDEK